MKILVTGGCKNGKSSLAERIAAKLSDEDHRYYVATMIPGDPEDEARIEKHKRSRAGKHFQTLERPLAASFSEGSMDPGGTFLVDSVTAILGNEMFRPPAWKCDLTAGERVKAALLQFAGKVRNAVFVTDSIGHDAENYAETTETYRAALADCGRALADICDTVIWVNAGIPKFIKREGDFLSLPEGSDMNQCGEHCNIAELVIGGAYQGKTDYVRKKYVFSEMEILDCGDLADMERVSRITDFRCVLHLEQYILECIKQNAEPVEPSRFMPGTVLTCNDIFCGVVPMNPVLRRWREKCGRYLARAASFAAEVTRVTCGIPERLKK